jgi:hypothetical protein
MEPGPIPTLTASAPASRQGPGTFDRRDVSGNHIDQELTA